MNGALKEMVHDENNLVLYVLIAEAILFIIGGFVVGLWPEIWHWLTKSVPRHKR